MEFTGRLAAAEGTRIALVVARFNRPITTKLLDGALAALAEQGVPREACDVAWVPGAFELPLAAQRMLATGRYAGAVCLGCVIRGETAHFDFVAGEAARGIARVALDTGLPVGLGVLMTETVEQALARAGGGIARDMGESKQGPVRTTDATDGGAGSGVAAGAPTESNRGADAALAVLEMIDLAKLIARGDDAAGG